MRKGSRRRKQRPVIFIASLDSAARLRWRRTLRNSFSVHDCGGISEVNEALHDLKPAVLLLDLNLLRLNGLQNLPSIQKLSPATKIIILTEFPTASEELSALKLGAKGYSGKDISADLLRRAVRLVERGEFWVERKIIPSLLAEVLAANGALSTTRPRALLELLTIKKREIMRLVAAGVSNKETARRLNVSEATVKAHLTAIFRKFALSNRAQLAALAAAEPKAVSTSPTTKLI